MAFHSPQSPPYSPLNTPLPKVTLHNTSTFSMQRQNKFGTCDSAEQGTSPTLSNKRSNRNKRRGLTMAEKIHLDSQPSRSLGALCTVSKLNRIC